MNELDALASATPEIDMTPTPSVEINSGYAQQKPEPAYQQSVSNEPYMPSKEPNKEPPFSFEAAIVQPARDMATHLGDVYGQGEDEFAHDMAMYEAIAGRKTFEQVEQDFNPSRLQVLRAQRISAFQANVSNDVVHKFGNEIAEAVAGAAPSMMNMFGSGLETGAATAGAGALIGAEATAIGGVTVPAGAAAGAAIGGTAGFTTGLTKSAVMSMSGRAYGAMRRNGVSHENAVPWSIAAGALEGKIATLRLQSFGTMAGRAAGFFANAPANVYAWAAGTARLASDLGISATQGWLQEATEIAAEYAAAVTGGGKTLPTSEEFIERTTKAALANATIGGVLHASGASLGLSLRAMRAITDLHKGEPLKGGVSIETAAAEVETKLASFEAKTAEGARTLLETQVNEFASRNEPVPTGLWSAYIEASKAVEAAEAKVQKAREQQQFIEDAKTLEPGTRLAIAKDRLKKASNHLETVRYEIEQIEDNDQPVPGELRAKRKEAAIEKRQASEEHREAELTVEKDKIQERLNDPNAGEGVRISARKALGKIDKELNKIAQTAALRGLAENTVKADAEHKAAQDVKSEVKAKRKVSKLKQLTGLVEEGELSTQELLRLGSEIDSKKLASVVRTTQRQVLNTLKASIGETRRVYAQDQALAERYIRLTGISKADQAKLKTFKVGDNLREYIDYVDKRVGEFETSRATKEANNRLDAVLKQTEPKVIGDRLTGKPTVQAWLNTYREFIRNPELAKDALENISPDELAIQEVEPGAVHPAQRLVIAAETAGVKTMTPEEKHTLADHIESIIEKGKDDVLEAKAERDRKLLEGSAGVVAGMDAPVGKAYEQINPISQHLRVGKDAHMMTWNVMVDTIFQRLDRNSPIRKWLEIREVEDAEVSSVIDWQDRMYEKLTGGNNKAKSQLVADARVKYRKEFKGKVGLENSSADQLKQVYAWMQDDSLRGRLEDGNGYTLRGETEKFREGNSDQAKIERVLNGTQIAQVDAAREFYRDLYRETNAAHVAKYGYKLNENKQYAGPAYGTFEDRTSNDFVTELYAQRSIAPGFTKVTKANVKPIEVVGLQENMRGYIDDMQHFIHWTKEVDGVSAADRLRAVFSDPKFRQAVEHNFGKEFYRLFNEAYGDLSGIKPIRVKQLPLIGEANSSGSRVIANALQLLKQPSGVWMYLSWLNVYDLATGAHEIATNFDKYGPMFDNMNFMKARKEGKYQDLKSRLQDTKEFLGDSPVKQGLRWLANAQSLPLELADRFNIYFGGGALYLKTLRDGIKAGLSETEAAAEAESMMAAASVHSQGSSLKSQRTPMERDSLGAALSKFTKPTVQAHFTAATDVRNFLANPTPANAHKALASSIAVRAAEVAFVTASAVSPIVGAALTADSDDGKKLEERVKGLAVAETLAMTLGPATGLPMAGRVITSQMLKLPANYIFNADTKMYSPDVAALQTISLGMQAGWNTGQVVTERKVLSQELAFEIWREANKSIMLMAFKLNFEEIRQMVQLMADMSEDKATRKARKRADRQLATQYKRNRE